MTDATHGRILVVDDDLDNAESLTMLLRINHYDAHACLEPTECLEAVERLRPDVVLLDLAMRGMTGYQIAEKLRAKEELRSLVLIALTGYGADSDRQQTQASGFDQHLVKPVAWPVLDAVLKSVAARD